MKNRFLTLLLGLVLLASCNTSKEILYFQDIAVNQPEAIVGARDITVQPKDQISIMVSSKDPQLAALFNLTRVQYRAGATDLRGGSNNGEISGYTLDDKGNIDFPVIGSLHIAGMTKSQIAALIKKRLVDEDLVKDPVVTVEFMNLYFSVLGEVKLPANTVSPKTRYLCWKPSVWRATLPFMTNAMPYSSFARRTVNVSPTGWISEARIFSPPRSIT